MSLLKPTGVRPAAASGRFYPNNPVALRKLINDLLLNARVPRCPAPKALIAPHAGYIYSGPIAASAYACLRPDEKEVKRIVLLGPSHFVALKGMATCSAEAFATPLGNVRLDREAIRQLLELPTVRMRDDAHAREHSLEVHLPFLQVVLGSFTLVPLVVGEAAADEIAEVLNLLWGGRETRFVISSDLSHYLSSERAREVDRATANAIERLDPEGIGTDQACGRAPICGMLRAASAHGLRPRTVDLRNSGDTAGPRDQVVGYGAFVFDAAGG